ncbi:MAG: transporter substrate-binding domain-containing protein [Idiomarina sp.]|nr:transporter substrate-binding domain-containing protein [Idiomarina sp.]
MMKSLLVLFIALSVNAPVAASTHSTNDKALVIGTMQEVSTDHPSFRLIEAAYQSIGYQVTLLPMPYPRSWYESNRGAMLDGELARTEEVESESSGMIRIPVPIFQTAATVFTRDPNFRPTQWQDLEGQRIDVLHGTTIITARLGDIPAQSVSSIERAFMRLKHNRSDVVVLPREVAQAVLKEMNSEGIHQVSPDLETWNLYHYIHERHRDIVPALTDALQQVFDAQQASNPS